MRTEPELEVLIQEFKNLQLSQARIQARQAAILNLLEAAIAGTEDNLQASRTQATQEDNPQGSRPRATQEDHASTPSQTSSSTGRKDKYGSALKVGDKVQILTLRGIQRTDGIIVGFTPKRVKVRTGTPPEVIVRADSNLVRVIDV